MAVTNPYVIARGAPGIDAGLYFTFDNAPAMADPGAGGLRLNNSVMASVTAAAISDSTADAGNPDVAAWIAALLGSTATIKGFLSIIDGDSPGNWFRAEVTAVSDESGWAQLTLQNPTSNGELIDSAALCVAITPTGGVGEAWDQWEGAWLTATGYVANDLVEHNGSTYTCISAHTSGSTTEPGVGVDWATVWALGAARGADGSDPGILLTFDDGIGETDPGSGKVALNHATATSATVWCISKTGRGGDAIATALLALAGSTSAVKGRIWLTRPGDATQLVARIVSVADDSGFVKVTVADAEGASGFTDDDALSLQWTLTGDKGDQGEQGEKGDRGISLEWNTDNDDSDPGSGKIKADNDDLSAATLLYVSETAIGGSGLAGFLAALDDSTSTAKGTITLTRASDQALTIFAVTGFTDATDYGKVAVTYVSGETGFSAADVLGLEFTRTGDQGDGGPAGSDPGVVFAFDDGTTDSDPGSGNLRASDADLASAFYLYASKTDADGNDVENFLNALDDADNANKGTLIVARLSDGARAVWRVTEAVNDTDYVKVGVAGHSGATSFTDADALSFQFSPAGNDGSLAGPVSSTAGNLPEFDDGTGTSLRDSGLTIANLISILGLAPAHAADTDHDITFSPGTALDDTGAVVMRLAAALTKRADAEFGEGDEQGGMVSGESLPTSGTIHWWLIAKADGTTDICCNNHATSGISPTLPSGFDYKRRIASLMTDGSANIEAFLCDEIAGGGLDFTARKLATSGGSGTGGALFSVGVPLGVAVRAKMVIRGTYTGSSWALLLTSAAEANLTPDLNDNWTIGGLTTELHMTESTERTNTSGQLRLRGSHNITTSITRKGWIDDRR